MSAKKIAEAASLMTKEFLVPIRKGIHARPAALFVKIANRFSCDVFVEKDGERVNGKSIIGLLMLGAGPGSRLKVHAEGNDASRALGHLAELFRFWEKDIEEKHSEANFILAEVEKSFLKEQEKE